jgi:hypothetical protein
MSENFQLWAVATVALALFTTSSNTSNGLFIKKLYSLLWPDNFKEEFVLVAFKKCTLLGAHSVLMLAPPPCPLFSRSRLIVMFVEQHIFCCLHLLSDDAKPTSCKQEKTILPPDVFFSNLANTSSSSAWNTHNTPHQELTRGSNSFSLSHLLNVLFNKITIRA